MKRKRVAMTISLPPGLAKDYENLTKHEAENKRQLFRDMFQVCKEHDLEQEFLELQKREIF